MDVSKYPDVCQISKTSVSQINSYSFILELFSFCKYKQCLIGLLFIWWIILVQNLLIWCFGLSDHLEGWIIAQLLWLSVQFKMIHEEKNGSIDLLVMFWFYRSTSLLPFILYLSLFATDGTLKYKIDFINLTIEV